MYDNKVVPFMSSVMEGEGAAPAAEQLQRIINEHTSDGGWQLDQVANVNLEVKPGCLSALFGGKSAYLVYNQIIFKKPK